MQKDGALSTPARSVLIWVTLVRFTLRQSFALHRPRGLCPHPNKWLFLFCFILQRSTVTRIEETPTCVISSGDEHGLMT
jgi:hypothetical protein